MRHEPLAAPIPRTPDAGDAAQRGDAILSMARQAFVEKGFDGASMQDLARAAGMSAGNFYRYFPSKDAIVEALIARDLAEVEAIFQAILASPDPLAALRAGLRERLIRKCEDGDTLWAEIAATAVRKPEVAAILARMEEGITRRIAVVIGVSTGLSEAEAQERFLNHARLIFLIMHGTMCSRMGVDLRDTALTALILRTVDKTIDDALADLKDH